MKVKFNLEPFGIDTKLKQIPDGKGNQLSRRTLETILSFITSKYYFNEKEGVRINHKEFANINNNYRLYLDYLAHKEIIFVNRKYKVGKYSRKYMFTDFFKEKVTINSMKDSPPKETELKEVLLNVDTLVMEHLQEDIRVVRIADKPVEKEIAFYKGFQPIVKFKKYLSNEYNLLRLIKGDRKISLKAERLYTPFVQLSKNIRTEYFSFEGNGLTSLDIKRSFPLWLSVWLIDNEIYMDYDTKEFISSVKSGKFYNHLVNKFNKNRNLFNDTEFDKPLFDKDKVKELFSSWLNGRPNKKNLHNYVMKAHYPLIHDFVKHFKKGCKERMYYTLANLESNFILNKICKRLYQDIPGIRLITCHDEIYFEERFNPRVEEIWTEELQLVYDRLPSVSFISDDDEDDEDFNTDIVELADFFSK